MSGFLNIRSSRLKESCKKVFLTFLQNSLKNIKIIPDAVFNLKFQAKRSKTFLKRDSGLCAFLRISQKFEEHLFCRTPTDFHFWNIWEWEFLAFWFLKFGQILWKIPAKDFTSVVILKVTEKWEPWFVCSDW